MPKINIFLICLKSCHNVNYHLSTQEDKYNVLENTFTHEVYKSKGNIIFMPMSVQHNLSPDHKNAILLQLASG